MKVRRRRREVMKHALMMTNLILNGKLRRRTGKRDAAHARVSKKDAVELLPPHQLPESSRTSALS
jgi:hypothetical protein